MKTTAHQNDAKEFFENTYESLRGFPPMLWMKRMFSEIIQGNPPSLVDLPTGAGKTDLIVIWLISLAWHGNDRQATNPIPRRLVWVVNRRVLVQQVFELAESLQKLLSSQSSVAEKLTTCLRSISQSSVSDPFAIVQLRGQLIDDREWSLDPTQPQLIIGTVDQIGSRLLFQGYGQGKWSRPLQAAFLGSDAWVCIDEAHLVPAFAVSMRQVREQITKPTSNYTPDSVSEWFNGRELPFWFTELSATPGLPPPMQGSPFRLTEEEAKDPIIAPRILAKHTRRVVWKALDDPKKLASFLAKEAMDIANNTQSGAIAVFCGKVTDAQKVARELQKRFPEQVLLVTGRLRGYERDRLEKDRRFRRFKQKHSEAMVEGTNPSFLVGTSAAEVGLDADSSAIVCDFASLLTLIQRLGRLDRRGELCSKAKNEEGEYPTMTIIGGSDGQTKLRQLESLTKKLSEQPTNYSEYCPKLFSGSHWLTVIGKDKADKDEEDEEKTPKYLFSPKEIVNPDSILDNLRDPNEEIFKWLVSKLPSSNINELDEEQLIFNINRIIERETIYDESRFNRIKLSDQAKKGIEKNPKPNSKGLFSLNKALIKEIFKDAFSADAKHGSDDAILSATWKVLNLPASEKPNKTKESSETAERVQSTSSTTTPDKETANPVTEASQPGTWLAHSFAALTAGPVVVPPVSDSALQRWAATTVHPSPYLPVHPWLYGLLPDEEGMPLVGLAFRLELDVFAHCEERDEETEETNKVWEKVKTVLIKFPPLRSELHSVPLNQVQAWTDENKNKLPKLAHFDGETWSQEARHLTINSVLVLPTSCDPELVKPLLPGTDESEMWDVLESMAKDSARYKRVARVTRGSIQPSDGDDAVYRVSFDGQEEKSETTASLISPEWASARVTLDFSKNGLAYTLRYYRRTHVKNGEINYLNDHLDAAGDFAQKLVQTLFPGADLLANTVAAAARDHDLGKDHSKWQQAMGNTRSWRQNHGLDSAFRIAKPVIENPGSAGGYRHEWGSLMRINGNSLKFLEGLSEAERQFYTDLYLHLIATHHGYFRPSMPDRGFDSPPTPAKQNPLRLECVDRAARLHKQLGYWRLAYLESLLKVADVASNREADTAEVGEPENADEA